MNHNEREPAIGGSERNPALQDGHRARTWCTPSLIL